MDKSREKALQDFVAEAEDLLEALAEDLDAAQGQFEGGKKVRPDLVNKVFREMHSLKGLASMFGLERITSLSHDAESLLDKVRLGKTPFSNELFALLREVLHALRTLVGEAAAGGEKSDVEALIARIAAHGTAAAPAETPSALGLDEQTLKSLTEYEEHRLKENLAEGNRIFAIRVSFDFSDFDTRLRALTERLSESGEVVSTLPVMDGAPAGGLQFRLLFGTTLALEAVRSLVAEAGGTVEDLTAARRPEAGPAAAQAPAEEPGAEAVEAEAEDLRSLGRTVKVDIEKLDGVMGLVGELNLVKAAFQRIVQSLKALPDQRDLAADAAKHLRTMEKKLAELQRSIIDIRLVPIRQIYSRLNRTARRLARVAGKEVSVTLYGGETELDKTVMDELVTPLIHILRNAIDHGIEPPGERVSLGKPREGTLAIRAYQKGNSIVIEVSDDGRGLQTEKIREKAAALGLVAPDATLDEDQVLDLIFRSGFSSAEEVTEVSGRGVGLDAVKTAIDRMKGNIAVWSEPGRGTTFQITLPITLAIIQSLIVRSCGQTFAIPISSVLETLRTFESEIQLVDQREVFHLRGATLPLLRLEERFHLQRTEPRESERVFIVVARRGDKAAGILVDDMVGEQETVVHPIGKTFGNLPGLAGATEVGENQVVLVIDTASLFAAMEGAKG